MLENGNCRGPRVLQIARAAFTYKDISISCCDREWRRPADGAPAGRLARSGRADPASARGPVRARRAHRQRTDTDPGAEPATRFAPPEAAVRSRASRPLPRGQLG